MRTEIKGNVKHTYDDMNERCQQTEYRCYNCQCWVDQEDVVWVNPKTGEATTGDNGKPYCVSCAPENMEYRFEATGGFDIPSCFEQQLDASGKIFGFKLKDGRIVRLAVCLEVESKDGKKYKYITKESEMCKLGFCDLAYDELSFVEL